LLLITFGTTYVKYALHRTGFSHRISKRHNRDESY